MGEKANVRVNWACGARPAWVVAVACTSRLLRSLADLESQWERQFGAHFGGLLPLLAAKPPAWWHGQTWKARFVALCVGAEFDAQVFFREVDNPHEDFAFSSYDATLSLSTGSRAAAAAGDTSLELHFSARYLPMGSMPAVEEQGVQLNRLRTAPAGSSPFAVFQGAEARDLREGQLVQVQWRGRQRHPWGWWLATVQAIAGDRLTLLFRQYPRSSVWRRVRAKLGGAVVNNDASFGFVGGVLPVAEEERAEWLHAAGVPSAQAPHSVLAPLPEDEEGEWSEGEEEEFIHGLDGEGLEGDAAAVLEAADEEPPEPQAAGMPAPLQQQQEGLAAVAVGMQGPEAHVAPHAPPAQAVAMQLGPAAANQALALPPGQQD